MTKKLILKRLILLFYLGTLCILWSCKSNNILKDQKYSAEIATLDNLFNKESYYIEIEVVHPFNTAATSQVVNSLLVNTGNNANRIDVRGDGNFIEIHKDAVKGILPFFGERRLNGGSYGRVDGSIAFNSMPTDFEKIINTNKRKLEINFKTNQNGESSESYDVNLVLFPNNRVEVKIASTFKNFISYTGTLKSLNIESQQ